MARRSITTKLTTLLGLVIVLATASAAINSNLTSPSILGSSTDDNKTTFTVQNTSNIENVFLRLYPSLKSPQNFSLEYNESNFQTEINISEVGGKGVYGAKFFHNSTSFPVNGRLKFVRSGGNITWKERSENFTNSNSESSDCNFYSNDFSCGYETFQAQMIDSQITAYRSTKNATYLERAKNFSLSSYDDPRDLGNCDHTENDFDCNNDGNADQFNITSAERQGSLITSLWKAYQYSRNTSIEHLAQNYTQGSAENCDVWSKNPDYSCRSSQAQGQMMNGYWLAYQNTGNTSYKWVAKNLSRTNKISPTIARAYFKAYEITENKDYLKKADNISKRLIQNLSEKDNYSEKKYRQTVLTIWKGYQITENAGYYNKAINLSKNNQNFSCNFEDYNCGFPNEQGLTTRIQWEAYENILDEETKISNPIIKGKTISGENLTIKAEVTGKADNLSLRYKMRSDRNWTTCDYNLFNGCRINGEDVTNQTSYSYYLKNHNSSFPENGSFKFTVSLVNSELANSARNISDEDPESFCAPNKGDYSCEDSYYQNSMILGYVETVQKINNSNYSRKLRKLLNSPFRTQAGSTLACAPTTNDYDCNTSSVEENLPGSRRQGKSIKSFFSSYKVTKNPKYYEIGKKFAQGAAEDCNVWEKDFNCASGRGQSKMIQGYLQAYKTTGNLTYEKIAYNLSQEALEKNNSKSLSTGLWQASSITGNKTFETKANKINLTNTCENSCNTQEYINLLQTAKTGYKHSLDDYKKQFRNLTNTKPINGCTPFGTDNNCSSPDLQGDLIRSTTSSAYSVPLKFKTQESFQISSKSIKINQTLSTTCRVTNKLEENLTDVKISIQKDSKLQTNQNLTNEFDRLGFNETIEVEWVLDPEETGEYTVNCNINSSEGFTQSLNKKFSVKEITKKEDNQTNSSTEDQEDSDSGGGGGGDPITYTKPFNPTEHIEYNYTDGEINQSLFNNTVINLSEYELDLNSSCFDVKRTLYQDNSTLNVEFSCQKSNIVIYDNNSKNTTIIQKRNFSGKIKQRYDYRGEGIWQKPALATYREIKPSKVKINSSITVDENKSKATIDISLNKEALCTVYNSKRPIIKENITQKTYLLDLKSGNNSIRVKCGEESKRMSIEGPKKVERPEEDDPEPLPFLKYLSILFITSSALSITFLKYKGVQIRNLPSIIYTKTIYTYYLRSFKSSITKGNNKKAIEEYKKLASLNSNNTSQELLNMNYDIMRGVKIYLLLDMVSSAVNEEYELPYSDIKQLVDRYMEDSEDEEMKEILRKKISEISNL